MPFLFLSVFALPCQGAPGIERPTLPILYHHNDSLARPVVLRDVLFLAGPRRATAYHLGKGAVLWDRELPELGRWECAEIIVSEEEIQILGERRLVRLRTSDGRLQQADPAEDHSGTQTGPMLKLDAPSQDLQGPTFTIDGPSERGGGVHEILRISPGGDPTSWKVELPLGGDRATGDADLIAVVCGSLRSTEHAIALIETGARSPRAVYQGFDELPRKLYLSGTRLVVHTWDGDTVVLDLANPGLPESKLPLRDRIRRRLLGLHDQGSVEERLDGLAPDLAANLLGLWPELSAGQRVGASSYFRKVAYRPAAPALAAALADVLRQEPRVKIHREAGGYLVTPFIEALGVTAGPEEFPVLASALDVEGLAGLRLQIAMALLAQGSPEAVRALESRLAPVRRSAISWWPPRLDGGILTQFKKVFSSGAPFQSVRGGLAWLGLTAMKVTNVLGSSVSERWLITPLILGGASDLWLAEVGPTGDISALSFLGECLGRGSLDPSMAPRIDGDTLELRHAGKAAHALQVHLPDLGKDGDRDGLPDVVERRMKTDPSLPDTDNDGLLDAVDPAPNAKIPRPLNEAQEIFLAAAEQFFYFTPDEIQDGLLAVALMDEALEWRGRRGPTITLGRKERPQAPDCLWDESFLTFSIRLKETKHPAVLSTPLRPDERLVVIDLNYGGLWGRGYSGRMRKIHGRWYIVELTMAWIS